MSEIDDTIVLSSDEESPPKKVAILFVSSEIWSPLNVSQKINCMAIIHIISHF